MEMSRDSGTPRLDSAADSDCHRVLPFRRRPGLDADERARLMDSYRGKWIAMRDGEVLADSDDLDVLLKMLEGEPDPSSLRIERLRNDT